MKKIITITFILFLLSSCNSNRCEETIQKERILAYINTVESYFIIEERSDSALYQSVRCISLLDEIMPIKSQVSLGDIAVYQSQAFREDKKGWLKWASENSCQLENTYLDSLEARFKIDEISLK
ncbi:MAG: lipoprotein [Saprospiraceae bacterium]